MQIYSYYVLDTKELLGNVAKSCIFVSWNNKGETMINIKDRATFFQVILKLNVVRPIIRFCWFYLLAPEVKVANPF